MRIIKAKKGYAIPLGWLGEAEATAVEFDVSEYLRDFGDGGSFFVLHLRNGDTEAYPCETERVDEDKLHWLVSSSDVSKDGNGLCQLIYIKDEITAKGERLVTSVGESLGNIGETPEPWEPFQEAILEAAAEALLSAQAAAASAEDAADSAAAAQSAASAAAESATDAGQSAEAAAGSASTAASKATAAANSATAAAGSAADSAESAESAEDSMQSAAASAASALASEQAAATSETAAAGSATSAEAAKDAAVSSKNAAAQSALDAAGSAAAALSSANTATAKATEAAGSATEAAGSATEAAGSATAAAGSAAEAAAILEEFTTPTASAETLEPGSDATASYADGHFTFGIPQGAQGEDGADGDDGITKSATAPTDTTVFWYDTTESKIKYYDAGEWKPVGSGGDKIFQASYARTTATEIKNYVNAGYVVVCKLNGAVFFCVNTGDYFESGHIVTKAFFYGGDGARQMIVTGSTWSDGSALESTANKVTAISASSTDTEYPSAKAVYNAIQSGGGQNDKTYVHRQMAAQAVWSVQHDLDKFPSVTVVDSTGEQVVGAVEYLNANLLTITFSSAFSGEAYCN